MEEQTQLAIKAARQDESEEKWSTVTCTDLPDHKSGAEEEAIWARLRFYNCPRMCVSEVLYDHEIL